MWVIVIDLPFPMCIDWFPLYSLLPRFRLSRLLVIWFVDPESRYQHSSWMFSDFATSLCVSFRNVCSSKNELFKSISSYGSLYLKFPMQVISFIKLNGNKLTLRVYERLYWIIRWDFLGSAGFCWWWKGVWGVIFISYCHCLWMNTETDQEVKKRLTRKDDQWWNRRKETIQLHFLHNLGDVAKDGDDDNVLTHFLARHCFKNWVLVEDDWTKVDNEILWWWGLPLRSAIYWVKKFFDDEFPLKRIIRSQLHVMKLFWWSSRKTQ